MNGIPSVANHQPKHNLFRLLSSPCIPSHLAAVLVFTLTKPHTPRTLISILMISAFAVRFGCVQSIIRTAPYFAIGQRRPNNANRQPSANRVPNVRLRTIESSVCSPIRCGSCSKNVLISCRSICASASRYVKKTIDNGLSTNVNIFRLEMSITLSMQCVTL